MYDVYTIGHSTHDFINFVSMLKSQDIDTLVDIRSFPGSRRFPHFNKESPTNTIPASGIEYIHILDLGGRRKVKKDSHNTLWRHPAFRGYADYMESDSFFNGINKLMPMISSQKVAYCCSEAVPWRCHRSMVSDYLRSIGMSIGHIMNTKTVNEHKYTEPARILENKLVYHE